MSIHARVRKVPVRWLGVAAATALGLVPSLVVPGSHSAVARADEGDNGGGPPQTCQLQSPGGNVKHVINLVFDNVHFTRDNPNVPSDLEQMPNLLNFFEQNGVVLSNMHTPLIAHTADDILTTLTGVYGDKHGQPVSNSYRVFNQDGTSTGAGSFAYWTDPVAAFGKTTDTTPTMVAPDGKTAPAPWVPFTRAGCDVGGFSTANIEVENADPDLKSIYGVNSQQWQDVLAQEKQFGFADLSNADYQGIAVHCANNVQSICAKNRSLAAPDKLPDEPHGYNNFSALYGNLNVGQAIGGTPVAGHGVRVDDLFGQPLTNDFAGGDVNGTYYGFPGFDPTAAQSLGYVADMQEHGIPVTYAYIADVHGTGGGSPALGPGSPTYEAQLHSYDAAFGQFFARLQSDGITTANTLFEISSDEGDHFAGTQHPMPAGCTGTGTSCSYAKGQIGEVGINLAGLLKEQNPSEASTDYQIHADSAPNFYIDGNPAAGSPRARQLEHEMAALTAPDPYASNAGRILVTNQLADQVEEGVLHFATGDPARMPSFTAFANPDFFLSKGSASKPCAAPTPSQTPTSDPCVVVDPGFAWNHGDVAPEINTNWAAFAGPGVAARGVDGSTWADETDIRPTMLALLGLVDDYQTDGRVLVEDVSHRAGGVRNEDGSRDEGRTDFVRLGAAYKQLDADVGLFGLATLRASTNALGSSSQDDATYTRIENALGTLGGQRDALAARIGAVLNNAGHDDSADRGDLQDLTSQAWSLIQQAEALAAQG